MPHVTFIYPCIGRFKDTQYVRSWQMEPLCIAVLSGLTPSHWQRVFFDDRLEEIDYEIQTDLVAISVETYTARRATQIAREFQRRGIPVVMGGYHATLCPEDVEQIADAVCVGEAEGIWPALLQDAEQQRLQKRYHRLNEADMAPVVDRSIFAGKRYLKIRLVETGRGCPFQCNFCSITSFYQSRYRRRPIEQVVRDIKACQDQTIFFVDDNLIADFKSARELFEAITPLKIQWFSQASINMAKDESFMKLMAQSGCAGVLIGFESLCAENIKAINKQVNVQADYTQALDRIRRVGIRVYGTFMFGHPHDHADLLDQTYRFALQQKLFLAAFNHVVPFPGTPLYRQLERDGRLKYEAWWRSPDYRFGELPFNPAGELSDKQVEQGCMRLRRQFYQLRSSFKRVLDLQCNGRGLRGLSLFWGLNLMMRKELDQKFGLPLGLQDRDE